MLNLNRLRMLSELSRLGTLAKVAEAMSYSPSTISQQLGVLEKEAGVKLLETVGRGVVLTPAGQSLVAHARAVLDRLEEAEAELASFQGSFTLRVASFQSVAIAIAPQALRILAGSHPTMSVNFSQRLVDEAHQGLLSHEFDIIIGEEFPGQALSLDPGLVRLPLLEDSMRLLLPQQGPLADLPQDFQELAHQPWAMDPAQVPQGRWARDYCRSKGFEPQVQFEAVDPLLQANFVREGLCLAILPSLIPASLMPGTRSVALPGDPRRSLYMAVRAGSHKHPAVLACRQAFELAAQTSLPPEPTPGPWAS